uniref:Si:dkeyp-121d4.3 n=1 Tax=Cyprinus carpio TaxID=7962 RepID=A0A8C1YND6_CYPCA
MGKNRKRLKGTGAPQAPGPGPHHGMRPTAPPPPHCGFRGPAPVRPRGPPGQRLPAPHRVLGPQHPRMMMDRGTMHHPMDFPDRRDFPPHIDAPDPHFQHPPEFGSGPPAPELEYGPRFRSPELDDRPPDFCSPGFHRMSPGFEQVQQCGPADPQHISGESSEPFVYFQITKAKCLNQEWDSIPSMAPPVKSCPPQPLKKKDQPAPKETEPPKSMASKISTFKNISANTPRGRSLGVISLIGNNCGFIEREDLKKFSFIFDAFFGNRTLLVPGVKVHFTAVKNLGKECAVDVKVAPGGTEDIDSTLYEGVVLTALPDDNIKEANPGRIRTFISTDQIELPFGKADTGVTLLLYDLVEFQLLTNVITKEQRATNIKPKTPDTFQLTKEVREMGVVMKKSDGTLTIMTEKHDNLTACATDTLSDDELNVMDEVELTILTVNDTKKAVRLKKLPEGSVTFNRKAKGNENISGWKPVTMKAGSQDSVSFDASSEKYEGTITKIAPKKSPSKEKMMDNQEPTLGLLVTTVEGTEKQLSFRSGNVITKATMMVGDKVQFNIFTNSVTKEECAVNVKILPETFLTDSEEQRKIGLVVELDDNFGFIKTQQDPQLFFDVSEVMEDTKLKLSEKVEFTLVPVTEGGKQAVRIRRLNESVFTSAPKLEAFGVKEKGKDITLPSMSSARALKKESDLKLESTKGDRIRSRSRENSQRRYSRSRSRSRSRDRSRSYYRSSSRERRDDQYRYSRSWSKEHEERYRQSRSRSRERSSQSPRKRSRSPADQRRFKSPENVEEELLRKRRELMELNELIARKKAIVAMEQNAKEIEPEDGKSGVTTFDYQHVHHENIWMPDLKPVKSILKKQSEPHTDSQSQASTSKETAAFFVRSQKMQIGYPQQTNDFDSNTPGYSAFESTADRTLTTARSEKTSSTQIQDPELVSKKKQLEDLSESIARKRAIIALEQKVRVVREMPEMEAEYEFDSHTENQFVMSKGNLWSCDIQPKKSVLKKHSEILMSQSDTTSVDEYGQQSQDDSSFTKPPSQTAALPFNRSSNPQPIHPGTLGLFNRIMNESSAASQMTETPPFNKPVIPQSLMQASSSRYLHDLKSSNISKANNSQEDQHRASSRLPHDHPPSSNPSTSQTSPSDPKRNLTTQMERFLSALNKADASVVNSLFQEARKDLALMNTQKPTQPQLDRSVPFMDELYDPFKEDEDNDHTMVSENWSAHKEGPNQFSEKRNRYEEETNLCATEHKHYTDDGRLYREPSRSVEYQKVNPNVQHSYVEDREMHKSKFDKNLACQESEESSEDKVRKSENFEKIQSLLQTIGLHLDTAEVSKLADRTQERLYGKMRKPQSASSHSFDQKRERFVSQTEQRGSSSRADSSDSESFRSVSPTQASSRKVYMSYEDSVKDQHNVEDVDLTSIKRTVVNLKPATDEQDPYEPELTAVSQASYQPVTTVTAVQPDYSQYAQNFTVSTFSASQYSQYQSSGQNVWGSVFPGLYPYGTIPSSPYAIGHQAMAPPMMPAAYSWYTAQMANPYCVLPPVSMPHPYGPPPISNPLHLSAVASTDTNQEASQIPPESITRTPVRCLKKIKTVPTVKAGPAIITEEAIKARQKKRLEQFNLRMKLKNEQQMEAQRSRGQNPNSAPGKSTPNEIKNVWICGHSLVFWAEKRATSPEYGVQLGMHPDSVRIWWKGIQGMTWQQLIPLLLQHKDNWPKPDVLIIHLGGNDISTTAPETFIETVKKDISSLKSIFPKCRLVWSSILSRQSWRGTEDSKEMDIIRIAVNDSIYKIMKELGGYAIKHHNIKPSSGVYRTDGIHLSGKGIDVFNLNLQAFLEKWERNANKTETSDPSV